MKKHYDPVTPGEVLLEEFMKPLNISQNRLARDIDVPISRINDVIHGKRSMNADLCLRLGKYFNNSPEMWLNLQSRYDLETATLSSWPKAKSRVRIFDVAYPLFKTEKLS